MKRGLVLILFIVAGMIGFFFAWDYSPMLVYQWSLGIFLFMLLLVIIALFLYHKEFIAAIGYIVRQSLSPVFAENYRTNVDLARRFEVTEKALDSFAGAMQEYAKHMASHTSAIQGLSEASQSLKVSAAEQNRILSSLAVTFTKTRTQQEVSRVARVADEFAKKRLQALRARAELEKRVSEPGVVVVRDLENKRQQALRARDELRRLPVSEGGLREEPRLKPARVSPPGCAVNPAGLARVIIHA